MAHGGMRNALHDTTQAKSHSAGTGSFTTSTVNPNQPGKADSSLPTFQAASTLRCFQTQATSATPSGPPTASSSSSTWKSAITPEKIGPTPATNCTGWKCRSSPDDDPPVSRVLWSGSGGRHLPGELWIARG